MPLKFIKQSTVRDAQEMMKFILDSAIEDEKDNVSETKPKEIINLRRSMMGRTSLNITKFDIIPEETSLQITDLTTDGFSGSCKTDTESSNESSSKTNLTITTTDTTHHGQLNRQNTHDPNAAYSIQESLEHLKHKHEVSDSYCALPSRSESEAELGAKLASKLSKSTIETIQKAFNNVTIDAHPTGECMFLYCVCMCDSVSFGMNNKLSQPLLVCCCTLFFDC